MSTAAVDLVKLTVRRAEFVKTGMVRSRLNSGVLSWINGLLQKKYGPLNHTNEYEITLWKKKQQ